MIISNQRYELAQKAHKDHWEKRWKGNRERQERTGEYRRYQADLLKKYVNFGPDSKILDVGCGLGGLINYLDQGERYGLDTLMNYFLQNFDMHKEVRWVEGRGENLPFPDDFFDVIISTNFIDHIQDPLKTLSEMRRAAKRQGFLFLTVDTFPWWVKPVKVFLESIGRGNWGHPYAFTRNEAKKIVGGTGFKIIKIFNESDNLKGVIGDNKEKDAIPFKSQNKITRIFEIKKQRGCGGLFRESLGVLLSRIFQEGRFYNKRHTVFIAIK
ncbi:MAG: class I SAM-dependent methyltransferase [Candidatus Nealsonbacteria bacterium]|nr:class I SAM-dependent methyltransferase [Candidatus Nealsonbacteria bacterium]